MVTMLEECSPIPQDVTTHFTINHEAAQDLDSSNAFEGPEKLLEVWFCESPDRLPASAKPYGLKAVPFKIWEDMLDLVSCKVLSTINSDQMDAYLLSESSMFVFPHKMILKTCGTTTLLLGLSRLLEIAAVYAGFISTSSEIFAVPHRVFYSRKNFLFPDKQRGPHRSWNDEVTHLDKVFLNGSAYLVGKMNGDHWYLYLTVPDSPLTSPISPNGPRCHSPVDDVQFEDLEPNAGKTAPSVPADETLEILMTDLDQETARQFHQHDARMKIAAASSRRCCEAEKMAHTLDADVEDGRHQVALTKDSSEGNSLVVDDKGSPAVTTEGHVLGTAITKTCGLADVYSVKDYPEAKIDAYCFEPCGFSANGVIPPPHREDSIRSSQAHYFTVHVTPEPHCSYASFETNVPSSQTGRETRDVIEQVVDIFKPGRFSVTLFEATTKPNDQLCSLETKAVAGAGAVRRNIEHVKGYRRVDRVVHGFDGYDLVFRYFERKGWAGGASRLGEA